MHLSCWSIPCSLCMTFFKELMACFCDFATFSYLNNIYIIYIYIYIHICFTYVSLTFHSSPFLVGDDGRGGGSGDYLLRRLGIENCRDSEALREIGEAGEDEANVLTKHLAEELRIPTLHAVQCGCKDRASAMLTLLQAVCEGQRNSHKILGWECLTDAAIRAVSSEL